MTAPRKLQRLHKKLKSYQAVAKAQNVNVFWVIQVLTETGREPVSKDIRAKLFLPLTHRAKPGTKQDAPVPPYLNWWRHLTKEERRKIMLMAYIEKKSEEATLAFQKEILCP
jgi:hypothetical protein